MQQELKKFNKEISITIPVDAIAKQLYATMNQSNPHSALITNTIIGVSLEQGRLSIIYNALNGYVDEINITEGKQYTIAGKNLEMYKAATEERESDIVVTVDEVNEYRYGNKIHVSYSYRQLSNSTGGEPTTKEGTHWVDHNNLVEYIAPIVVGHDIDGPTIPTD